MKKIRLLLADRNYHLLEALSSYLKKNREIEDVITESEEGKLTQKICAETPDVTIIDCSMKKGLKDLEELKKLLPGAGQKLILLFSEGTAKVEELAKSLGARDWLTKPVAPGELLKRILAAGRNDNMPPVYRGKTLPQNIGGDIVLKICTGLGIGTRLSGYKFLRECVRIITESGTAFSGKIEEVYRRVAARYSTTVENVERLIRYAISKAWKNGQVEKVNSMLGRDAFWQDKVPGCAEFIMTLVSVVRDVEALAALQT